MAYCIRPLLAASLALALAFTLGCEEKTSGKAEAAKPAQAENPAKTATSQTFTDPRDGKTYKTVNIGTQTWMAENLNYDAKGSLCYDNDPANCKKYGRLYDWKTALSACPKGWHLPVHAEWGTLVDFAGDKIAGKKLKAKSGWDNYEGKSGNGTDEYGFSALPGGYVDSGGRFGNVGKNGCWWSATAATEIGASYAFYRIMGYFADANGYHNDKTYLYSVRCIQDKENKK